MNNAYELAKCYLKKHRYKVVEDEDGDIVFHYQLNRFHIFKDQQSDGYLMVLSNLDKVSDVDKGLKYCNEINVELKQVKVYVHSNHVFESAEVNFLTKDDMEHQMDILLKAILVAKKLYKKYISE